MRLLALIVSISMMTVACGGDDDSSAPVLTLGTEPATTAEPATTEAPTTTSTTAPSTTETTIDQEAQDRAEIEDVVQRFHAYYYEVGAHEGLPGFEEVATSPIYDRSLITVNDLVSQGYTVGEGDEELLNTAIQFSSPTTADVEGCLLDSADVIDEDGIAIGEPTPDPVSIITKVVLIGSQWLVADFEYRDGKRTICELH